MDRRNNSLNMTLHRSLCILALFLAEAGLAATNYPAPAEGEYVIRNFQFRSGETLPEVRMHYLAFGEPRRDQKGVVRNAVLILHGTTGSSRQFLRSEFASELFGKDQPHDAMRFYLVIPDNIGHGKSTKPSDGLHAKFPKYGYRDMIEAQYRLLTEGLNVDHLRLVMGTSMGGMHTWLWGEIHPDYMDALMPLASLPTQISGRNRVWRRLAIPLMGISGILLVGVLFTAPVFGAKRAFFNGAVQPSEAAMLSVVIYMAAWLSSKQSKLRYLTYGLLPFALLVYLLAPLIEAFQRLTRNAKPIQLNEPNLPLMGTPTVAGTSSSNGAFWAVVGQALAQLQRQRQARAVEVEEGREGLVNVAVQKEGEGP